jgi:prolyl-tRNA synthetase
VRDAYIVVDESARDAPNLVSGANREGYHLLNVNLGRDYEADLVADIALAEAGFPCPECGEPMRIERAIEVGNIFKLGTRYSKSLDATYLDAEGKEHLIVMGCYGIGSGRLLATVIEQRYDDKGILWPISVAPYHVSLIAIGSANDTETLAAADKLYDELTAAGVEVLYDDRDERPGVKFNDADLIGNPLRVAVSARNLANNQIELKRRTATEPEFVPVSDSVSEISSRLEAIAAEELAAAGS